MTPNRDSADGTGNALQYGIRQEFGGFGAVGCALTADTGCLDAPKTMPSGGARAYDRGLVGTGVILRGMQ